MLGTTTPEKLFGRVLRQIRTAKRVTQEDLAYKSGYDRSYVSQLERGLKNPSLKTILILAASLETSAAKMVEAVETQWK